MTKNFICDECKYASNNKYNFNVHITTDKHLMKVGMVEDTTAGIQPSTAGIQPSTAQKEPFLESKKIDKILEPLKDNKLLQKSCSKNFTCEYCNKSISDASHKTRHYRTCKEKKQHDHKDLVNRLNIAEQKAVEENKMRKEVEEDYRQHLKNVGDIFKHNDKTVINNINNIDKRQMNIYYVINNYTEVDNYEDIMAKKLSKAERAHVLQFGPSAGCEKIIINRCVTGLSKENRPIHCLDASRDKFIYKTEGSWAVDLHGTEIMKPVMAHVRTLYDITENNTDMNNRIKSMQLLMDMDKNAGKRTIRNLKKITLLNNDD